LEKYACVVECTDTLVHMFEMGEVVEVCRRVAKTDLGAVGDDGLGVLVGELTAARSALDAAELAVLGELDAMGVCDRWGSPTVMWVSGETRSCRATVATRVRVAAKLRYPFGDVAAALAAGTVTFDHARTLVHAANPRSTSSPICRSR